MRAKRPCPGSRARRSPNESVTRGRHSAGQAAMSPGRLVVYGAGGHGRVVADVGRAAGHLLVAFVDDDSRKHGTCVWSVPVVSWDQLKTPAFADSVIGLGMGDNAARQQCAVRLITSH